MPGHDPATLAFYAAVASDYIARTSHMTINRDLPAFLDRLQPGANVLELGCGSGRDAAYMEARGFLVEPTDGVAEMAALAEARLGRPVRRLRFEDLEAVAAYDAVYASYSLLHVPRQGLGDVLHRICTALKPGGWHMATYKSGGIEGRDGLGRYFNYLSREQAADFYARFGHWQGVGLTEGIGGGYDDRPSSWVNVIAQKAL
ncbi:MAG: methyltransferase domain-containing protein [Sphingomonadales bacterium]|nr:methyltransferase domain-containing protein [Sphingomonadales bacterium]